mmetsp:Transcript_7726/g.8861  ORF Transcript_7726/g.8861 Transcript_7726/m.8861 type:complete len:254 (+) Transcript_7726:276-1037(+)
MADAVEHYNNRTSVSLASSRHSYINNRDMLLHSRDAVSTGAGAIIGFSLFSSNSGDYFAGGAVLTLVILWISTPGVCDIETQLAFFEAFHQNRYNRFLHLSTLWPHYLTIIMLILGYSSHWAMLLSTIYSGYFIIADGTVAGMLASIGALLAYPLAERVLEQVPHAWEYALIANALCWTIQLCGDFVCERNIRRVSFSTLFLENYVHTMLMAPLFFVLELSMALGFRDELRSATENNVRVILASLHQSKKEEI